VNPLEWGLLGGGALASTAGAAYLHGQLSARLRALRGQGGLADRRRAAAAYGLDARRNEMAWVRPTFHANAHTPDQVGLYLGDSVPHRVPLFTSLEEAVLLIGPPRMTKTTGLILESVLSAPGACIATSLRPDLLLYTAIERGKRGPVVCWDAEGVAGWPHAVRWNPLRGCEIHAGALRRAGSLVCGGGAVIDEDFWTSGAVTILRCLLHAAALDETCTIADVRRWVANPANERALDILTTHPDAVPGYAEDLRGWLARDPRTLDGVMATATNAVTCLADPQVIKLCSPRRGEDFDPAAFVRSGGTLYLLCRPRRGGVAPLVTALVDELTEAVYQQGALSYGERLDPPCRFVLDECATVGPPNLVEYASYLGGSGGQLVLSFQAWAQARHKYTEHGADALRNNCTTKVILGGIDNDKELRDLSTLIGDRDELYATHTRSRGQTVTTTTNLRRVPILSPAQLHELPKGRHVIVATGRPKVIGELPALRNRPDWSTLAAGLEQARRITGRAPEEMR
jgi:type IV secretion system protein VirD4